MIGRIVKKYKGKKHREDMCLPELEKEIKRRKWTFIMVYSACLFLGYVGFVVCFDYSQIIAMLFLTLLLLMFTIVSALDYIYTRLLYYLKFNED